MTISLSVALAGPPGVLDASLLPGPPAPVEDKTEELCEVEWISDAAGRMEVFGVTGCGPEFERAVRDRLPWMTWKTPPAPTQGALDDTHAFITGIAGAPDGLYSRFAIRFDRSGAVALVPYAVVRAKRQPKLPALPQDLWTDVGSGCSLFLHVDTSGRTARVQSETCTDRVRTLLELALMAWTWDPLVVEGEPRSFAARYRVAPPSD